MVSSKRTEISCRPKSSENTNRESVAYRSFNFKSFKLEVSEKLPDSGLMVLSVIYLNLQRLLNVPKNQS